MTYDCIVLPGGGIDANGAPSAWVCARLDRALEMASSTCYFLVLSRGTTHRPPSLDKYSFPIDEATASAAYLIERDIPSNRILIENWSLDTMGNAYFARQCILEPMKLQRLAIITNDFHMTRTKLIFDWIFSLSDTAKEPCVKYQIEYITVSNQDMTDEQLIARIDKERLACDDLKLKIQRITNLSQMARFLFIEHGAYQAKSLHTRRSHLDPLTTSTYWLSPRGYSYSTDTYRTGVDWLIDSHTVHENRNKEMKNCFILFCEWYPEGVWHSLSHCH